MTMIAGMQDLTMREARDRYLADNGFDTAGYTADHFEVAIAGRMLRFRNPKTRQRVIPLHDLHHALTGYGTDLAGEAEIGAWELVAGCNTPFLVFINLVAVVTGMFIAPLRTLRAGWRARGQRSLYRDARSYEELLDVTIAELRREQGIPARGVTEPLRGSPR
jgi:hypothetical protein